MEKDFGAWHAIKMQLQERQGPPFFREREVWFCALGANIGCEEDGKGEWFLRPVIILRRLDRNAFLSVPLTTQLKEGPFRYRIPFKGGIRMVLNSQVRMLDRKRLLRKMGTIDPNEFFWVMKEIGRLLPIKTAPLSLEKGASEAEATDHPNITGTIDFASSL